MTTYTKKKLAFVIFALINLESCNTKEKNISTINNPTLDKVKATNFNNGQVPATLLLLAHKQPVQITDARMEGNLYGKFFGDKAEFYIIENPTNKIHNSRVKTITMSYLEGQLSQTKYVLTDDIVETLIRLYGSFRITGHDLKNQHIIKSKQVVLHTKKGLEVNKQLDNYELRWTLGETYIRYRVNLHEEKEKFKYVERVKNYKKAFTEIENMF